MFHDFSIPHVVLRLIDVLIALVKDIDITLQDPSCIFGIASYMAPEQAIG